MCTRKASGTVYAIATHQEPNKKTKLLKQGEANMTCKRCGGFKVFDYFYGLFHATGFRCVNCGAITDIQSAMPVPIRIVTPPSHAYRGRTTGKVSGRCW